MTITIAEALDLGKDRLICSSNPLLDARLLLEDALGRDHSYLVAHPEHLLSSDEEAHYRQRISRAENREPIPYILGRAPFYGLEFIVSPAVLIPRPETEHLLEACLRWVGNQDKGQRAPKIVDVGTGSGCLAILLAQLLEPSEIVAIDKSSAALDVARLNANQFDVAGKIDFRQGDLLNEFVTPVDLIVANLPYIADDEWSSLAEAVSGFEPAIALRGGPDGLSLIRTLLGQASDCLLPGGAIFLEIGWHQGATAYQLGRGFFPEAEVNVSKDYGGRDRILSIIHNEHTI